MKSKINVIKFTGTILSACIVNLDGVEPIASLIMEAKDATGEISYIREHYSLLKQDDVLELSSLVTAAGLSRIETPESMKKLEGRKISVLQTIMDVDGELAMMREFFPYHKTVNNHSRKDEKK